MPKGERVRYSCTDHTPPLVFAGEADLLEVAEEGRFEVRRPTFSCSPEGVEQVPVGGQHEEELQKGLVEEE